ncbi:MAG TPA: CDP-alcohol phosphatidyltransferase family protein [Thermoanaerobaculia bacterium]|nr:CDP-alcohol phosphatidyltransferase family protein [Thermoanaerobaculia bacterium]
MSALEIGGLLLLISAVFSMPVFALQARGRHPDANLTGRPTGVILGNWIREWFVWVIAPVERAAVLARVAPESFNYAGLALGAAAGVAAALGRLAMSGWLLLASGATDVLDGRIARARGLVSPFGAFLDSALDRCVEAFLFLGCLWYFRARPAAALLSGAALAGSQLVSYARARGQGLGVDCSHGAMPRAERIVLVALGAILDGRVADTAGWPRGSLLALVIGVVAAGAWTTAVYRTVAIARALRNRP